MLCHVRRAVVKKTPVSRAVPSADWRSKLSQNAQAIPQPKQTLREKDSGGAEPLLEQAELAGTIKHAAIRGLGAIFRRDLSIRAAAPGLRNALEGLAASARSEALHEKSIVVDAGRGTTFVQPIDVYSTPSMIWDMEWHARDIILAQLSAHGLADQWDSVGTKVEFQHSAAAPIGASVRIAARVTHVDLEARRVAVSTSFSDAVGPLGVGVHERALVDMTKIRKRIASRKEQIDEAA